jgi:HK97 gp10 family phage protein
MDKVRWTGLDQIEANLLKMAEMFGDDLRSAANTGATVIRDEVVLRAPEDKGILKSQIYQKHVDEESSPTRQVYVVSWRKGSNAALDAYYGFWVEYGHWYVPPKAKGITWKQHRIATKTTFVPAHPFLRPAYEAKAQQAVDVMRAKLAVNVQRTLASFNK